MTVIDLGERREVPPPAGPGPGRAVRRWAPALVALLCLAVLTAAAPQAAHPPGAVVPARPDADVVVAGDLLLVVDRTGPGVAPGPGPAPRVAAHQLPSGRPLWHLPLTGPVSPFPVVRVGDVVVLGMPEEPAGPQVVGLAAADGAVRWRVDGRLDGATPAGNLLVWGTAGTRPGAPVLRSVDAASGAVRWTRRLPPGALHWSTRDGRVTLLTVLDGGRLELRDPDSGDVLHAAALPAAAGPPEVLGVTDDVVLVSEGPAVLSAYDTAALRRRWSVPRGPSARPYAFGCGVVICVGDGGRLRLLDPATGSARWRADDWPLLTPVGDRLLAAGYPRGGAAEHVLLDAATGRPVRELGRWQLGDLAPWEDPAVLHRRQRDGRVLVARLDERGDGIRVLAALHGVVGACGAYGSLVLCRREGGAYGVWELPG
ncbi:PQQ-binding-like beta-propeller repeat protein [Micromonospora sp. NPDC049460]|uniref:outer membrane protein assembly factor BamB family protein n=1 Tax=unclassified Micromonospora TaxID=2617518 RepID=UPI0037213C28